MLVKCILANTFSDVFNHVTNTHINHHENEYYQKQTDYISIRKKPPDPGATFTFNINSDKWLCRAIAAEKKWLLKDSGSG